MNIHPSEAEATFRHEVRAFVAAQLPDDIRTRMAAGAPATKEDLLRWQAILQARGWLAPGWPVAHGGTGWSAMERFIFDEELAVGCAPKPFAPNFDLLGPVLVEYGTEAQQRTHLPRMLSNEDWWCQGFSEPGAGSDLAALKCRAARDGDSYVVSGTKLWTSYAHWCNWMFAMVRTSTEGKKQAGISFLLLRMDQPGVEVRPILTLGGIHAVNQVFIDDVRVPRVNLVGHEGQGWEIARFLLGHERVIGAGIGPSGKLLKQLRQLGAGTMRDGRPLMEHGRFADRLATLEIQLMALRFTAYRILADQAAGKAPGPEVSVLKLKGAEVQQGLSEMLMEAAGSHAYADPATLPSDAAGAPYAHLASLFLDRRKVSIYGGASEVQRNIIAHRSLHL